MVVVDAQKEAEGKDNSRFPGIVGMTMTLNNHLVCFVSYGIKSVPAWNR